MVNPVVSPVSGRGAITGKYQNDIQAANRNVKQWQDISCGSGLLRNRRKQARRAFGSIRTKRVERKAKRGQDKKRVLFLSCLALFAAAQGTVAPDDNVMSQDFETIAFRQGELVLTDRVGNIPNGLTLYTK